ncbi:MAG: hypothetical protein HQ564_06585 [Candidatus Saganbacteria bacterium]|nr:hypothetical protein [Candidatus Saganbacteria bacterium]
MKIRPIKLQSLRAIKQQSRILGEERPRNYLLYIIQKRNYSPQNSKSETDQLFKSKILRYAEGRYLPKGKNLLEKLNDLSRWGDLLGNKLAPLLINYDYLHSPKTWASGITAAELEDRIEAIGEFHESLQQIKIIEDFIFYHRDEIWRSLPLAKGLLT